LISAPEGEDSVEEIKIENIINGVKQIIDAWRINYIFYFGSTIIIIK
jgi:hypothetical protein